MLIKVLQKGDSKLTASEPIRLNFQHLFDILSTAQLAVLRRSRTAKEIQGQGLACGLHRLLQWLVPERNNGTGFLRGRNAGILISKRNLLNSCSLHLSCGKANNINHKPCPNWPQFPCFAYSKPTRGWSLPHKLRNSFRLSQPWVGWSPGAEGLLLDAKFERIWGSLFFKRRCDCWRITCDPHLLFIWSIFYWICCVLGYPTSRGNYGFPWNSPKRSTVLYWLIILFPIRMQCWSVLGVHIRHNSLQVEGSSSTKKFCLTTTKWESKSILQ
jgi:hypothetical protein